jgi:hypothetical protein
MQLIPRKHKGARFLVAPLNRLLAKDKPMITRLVIFHRLGFVWKVKSRPGGKFLAHL